VNVVDIIAGVVAGAPGRSGMILTLVFIGVCAVIIGAVMLSA
jgi:hypothetical protein